MPAARTVPASARPKERTTRQKRAVDAALDQTEGFTSAQDLHARLRADGERIGLATVYSQLRTLAGAGEIDSVRADSGETLYRRCGTPLHHHHLVCRRCGRTIELDAPELEAAARRLGDEHGFSDLDHVVEITGLCPACEAA
ncbi:MAG: Fur family transcriptional regulator [Acidimicrobiales bacterium]